MQAGLVQCIKCGGDEYFTKKLPLSFTCTNLVPSSSINLMTLGLVPVSQGVDDPQSPRTDCSLQFLSLVYLDRVGSHPTSS